MAYSHLFASLKISDPGVAWVLDFNNDGVVSFDELNSADEMIESSPHRLPTFSRDEL